MISRRCLYTYMLVEYKNNNIRTAAAHYVRYSAGCGTGISQDRKCLYFWCERGRGRGILRRALTRAIY